MPSTGQLQGPVAAAVSCARRLLTPHKAALGIKPELLGGLWQTGPELPALIGCDGIKGLRFLDHVDAGFQVPRRPDDAHEIVQDERPHGGLGGR
jgi:hypothetical protein